MLSLSFCMKIPTFFHKHLIIVVKMYKTHWECKWIFNFTWQLWPLKPSLKLQEIMTTCNKEQLQFLSLISHFTCYLQVLIIVYIALHTYCTWLVARNVSWLYWEGWQLLLLNTPLCYSFKHGHIFHIGYNKIMRKTEVFVEKSNILHCMHYSLVIHTDLNFLYFHLQFLKYWPVL